MGSTTQSENEKIDGRKRARLDVYFTAVDLINIPDEKELLASKALKALKTREKNKNTAYLLRNIPYSCKTVL